MIVFSNISDTYTHIHTLDEQHAYMHTRNIGGTEETNKNIGVEWNREKDKQLVVRTHTKLHIQ